MPRRDTEHPIQRLHVVSGRFSVEPPGGLLGQRPDSIRGDLVVEARIGPRRTPTRATHVQRGGALLLPGPRVGVEGERNAHREVGAQMGGQVVRAVCGVRQPVGAEYEPGVLDGAHREDDPGVIGHP